MDFDANDVKILVRTSLQFFTKTCRICVKSHPVVSVLLLLFFLLYIFIPSLFNILFNCLPLGICTGIFLKGRLGCRGRNTCALKPECGKNNSTSTKSQRFPRLKRGSTKLSRTCIRAAMSRRTFRKDRCKDGGRAAKTNPEDDLLRRLIDELRMPMKIQEDDVDYDFAFLESPSPEKGDDVPVEKEEENRESPTSDSTKIDSKSSAESDDDNKDMGGSQFQKNYKLISEWTEDDQRNLMDLGSSEIERNQRLENMIAKRRSRKQFSVQTQRHYHNFGFDVDQRYLTSIMTGKTTDEGDGQPGSAPSVLLPARNPFDIPYDPSEERPNLTEGNFDEFIFPLAKDMHYCRHQSFNYGPSWFMKDFSDEPLTSLFPEFFTKPKELDLPGAPEFIKKSVRANHVNSDSHDHPIPLPPKARDWNKSYGFSQNDQHTSYNVPAHRNAEHIGEEEINTKREQLSSAESKEKEDGVREEPFLGSKDKSDINHNFAADDKENKTYTSSSEATIKTDASQGGEEEVNSREAKQKQVTYTESKGKKDEVSEKPLSSSMDDPEINQNSIGDEKEEKSSSPSSEATEDDRSAVKNEALRNSVRKVSTCLAMRKKRGVSGNEELRGAYPHLEEYGKGSGGDQEVEGSSCLTSASTSKSLVIEENKVPTNRGHNEIDDANQLVRTDAQDERPSVLSSSILPNEIQRLSQDGVDSHPRHNSQTLSLPTFDSDLVAETTLFETSTSPRSVLHEADSLDDISSLVSEHNANNDYHPSVGMTAGYGSVNDLPHDQVPDHISSEEVKPTSDDHSSDGEEKQQDLAADVDQSVKDIKEYCFEHSTAEPSNNTREVQSLDQETQTNTSTEAGVKDLSSMAEHEPPSIVLSLVERAGPNLDEEVKSVILIEEKDGSLNPVLKLESTIHE